MSDFPPIPTLIRGAAGPITVRRRRKIRHEGGEAWGQWNDAKRTITLDKTATIEHQWRVLFHEMAHAALADSGLENVMDEKGVEAVCDAIASARIQEMRGELGVMDA